MLLVFLVLPAHALLASTHRVSPNTQQPRVARRSLQKEVAMADIEMGASAVQMVSVLLTEEVEEVGPVLLTQMAVVGGLVTSGFALDAFFEVEEPKEPGEEGPDIYRDSLLRYCGYANEVGEAFRPLVPVELVYFSYVIAITYILADTVDKGRKGAAIPGGGGAIRGTLGAADTFCWQMLASVIFPSFCINRLVTLLNSLQEGGSMPDLLTANWLPTVAGLLLIPAVILPLDTLAHFTLNQSLRRVSKTVLG